MNLKGNILAASADIYTALAGRSAEYVCVMYMCIYKYGVVIWRAWNLNVLEHGRLSPPDQYTTSTTGTEKRFCVPVPSSSNSAMVYHLVVVLLFLIRLGVILSFSRLPSCGSQFSAFSFPCTLYPSRSRGTTTSLSPSPAGVSYRTVSTSISFSPYRGLWSNRWFIRFPYRPLFSFSLFLCFCPHSRWKNERILRGHPG